MTILHVSPCLAPAWAYGRVAQDVDHLARAQAAAGHDVTVLTTDALAPHERLPATEDTVSGVRVIRLRNVTSALRTWFDLSSPPGFGARARALFDTRAIDIVHLHELTTVENVATLRVVPRDVPVVVSSHGKAVTPGHGGLVRRTWDRRAVRLLCARVSGVIEPTPAGLAAVHQAWRLAGCGEPRHTAMIPHGSTAASPVDGADTGNVRGRPGPSVLFAGALTRGGSLEAVVRAVARLQHSHASVRLVIAGGDHGGQTTAASLAASLGVADAVTWLGHVPAGELSPHIARADVVALPSGADPYGDLALSALARGTSVVAAVDAEAVRGPDREALTPVADDADAWCAGMAAHLRAHAAGGALRDAARATAARYTWAAIAEEVVVEYRRVAAAPG